MKPDPGRVNWSREWRLPVGLMGGTANQSLPVGLVDGDKRHDRTACEDNAACYNRDSGRQRYP